ncbi:MAG: tryptophan synthase subunit alpha [Elusimicrobia bacterium GWA2_69_24]|nr:MAG: tryptophan synthase subunit alpha [Elusimicrobia bacterium GWA2_69_24]
MGKERIEAAFARAAAAGRAAFVPYITAGDPSLDWTGRYLDRLAEAGADLVELGVPFSDPVADGPVNQRSAERALAAKTTLTGVLDLVGHKRAAGFSLPLVVFTYANPVAAFGWQAFARRAADAGVDAALVVDLPVEEAGEHRAACASAGLAAVFLAAPTTDDARLAAAVAASSGFLYCVARLGVTGAATSLAAGLTADMARFKRAAGKLPVAVGFGVTTPEQAAAAARLADGVIVGSALVRLLEGKDPEANGKALGDAAAALAAALERRC